MTDRIGPVRVRSPRLAAGILACWLLWPAGLSGEPPGGSPQAPSPDAWTTETWAADLDFLATELPKKHKNLFFQIPESEFLGKVRELKSGLSSLGRNEILVRFLQLVASVGDSHTTVAYRPQRGLPLMLYWFKDGIHVLNTTGEYGGILYGRITAVGGRPIDEVTAALSTVIPHENESQVRNQLPNFLADTAVLHGLGLIPSEESASLTVLSGSGETIKVDMAPVSFAAKPEWLVTASDESGAPLYLRKRNVFYWYEVLPANKALYFKYNSCRERKDAPFAAFVSELFDDADAGGIERIIVDLRHNGGGNSAIFDPFLSELKKRPRFLQQGGLVVLVGRRTFSSAILNALDLRKNAAAVFVGEPTGGKPNHYGEVRMVRLPGSGMMVTYSTKYFRVVDGDPETITPDISVEPTFADYRGKADPVLARALGLGR